MKRIPVLVFNDGLPEMVNRSASHYECNRLGCMFETNNKATLIGHLTLIHGIGQEDAIILANSQKGG